MTNSFKCLDTFQSGNETYYYYNLNKLDKKYNVQRLPFSLKVLLENLLRTEDGISVSKKDIEALLHWSPKKPPMDEIAFTPSRVLLQDFTGVPAVVDLAAMREAMKKLGGNPKKINPLSPVELVIDHSVMVDHYGTSSALEQNTDIEFERNTERYTFLRWGQEALNNFRVVPPGTGIVHQVNLEYLARVVFQKEEDKKQIAYWDTVVGTDSHTTMINGLGVLGWGVGGIEAEAAMLGQPITMLIPPVVGFKLIGKLPEGSTATDLVLTVVEMLRKKGVVGKFVEFYGDGLDDLPLADRATIANMAPEYGATAGMFPIDKEAIQFLKLSGRDPKHIEFVEAYAKAQDMFRTTGCKEAEYSDTLLLDLSTVIPCIAGPKRPQDRISLKETKKNFQELIKQQTKEINKTVPLALQGEPCHLSHGDVVIAAITSCTNTSNPDVMIAAGLLAKKALSFGLKTKPWVKTSLAPGSKVVTDYLDKSGLTNPLSELGFNLVGYGCTTCIGNSGPLPNAVSDGIKNGQLMVSAVLSGNRNFEGRIHPEVKNAYLASPPLVVAYALAGTMNIDLYQDPIGKDRTNKPVYLKDIWPSREEIQNTVKKTVQANMFTSRYGEVFKGPKRWQTLDVPKGELYSWDETSTYVKHPPYFTEIEKTPAPIRNIENASVLLFLSDSVTTDHISPAGNISEKSPAGHYLIERKIDRKDFNSYGARRGNHEVMMRGTFANTRLKNLLGQGTEGGVTTHLPSGELTTIYDASMRYQSKGQPLIILAGKEYGTGSSRDWAAKGTALLGVRAVIVESFERIHRSNLVGMGVLPLQFLDGQNAQTLGLTGQEKFTILLNHLNPQSSISVIATPPTGASIQFKVTVRIDTPKELEYYQHGGILHYVLRQLAK